MNYRNFFLSVFLLCAIFSRAIAQNALTEIVVKKTPAEISINKDMYGIFFEDINFAADGGLYAELVKNRSFEFPHSPLMGWLTYGDVEVKTENPAFDRNPHYVRITNGNELTGCGIINEGFRGIGVKKDETYKLSLYARTVNNVPAKLKIEIIASWGDAIASGEIWVHSCDWQKYQLELIPHQTDAKAKLRIDKNNLGAVDLEHISMFPADTWKGRENGMRKDLAQALADLHPGVFRFPGGCIVEGNNLETRYQWKNTIGPVENRPVNENRWNYIFQNRFTPDYFQSYGLGFYEFFQLCEDFGAEPLPVISCGLACQFATTERQDIDHLDPFIQDALDLIEFANGSVTSTWGKVRADLGHPAPFNLKYLSIGNEQWGEEFPKYLEKYIKPIKEKYPYIQLVGTAGPSPEGKDFDYLWKEMTRLKADLVDEHYYRNPDWFLSNARRYDNYDRQGPKVFAGEYACHDGKPKKNSYYSALCEAAFLTGIERNADVVRLATYAPLFANIDAWQWCPDLIWFDNLRSVRSINWYVQMLYSQYKGTTVLSATTKDSSLAGENGLYASAVIDKNKNQVFVKVANTSKEEKPVSIDLAQVVGKGATKMTKIVLQGALDAENTLDKPETVVPKTIELVNSINKIEDKLAPESFQVFVVEM